jgi:hypothetical protein
LVCINFGDILLNLLERFSNKGQSVRYKECVSPLLEV